MRHPAFVTAVSVLSAFALALPASAGRFSDVPDSHIHRNAIERLADIGVVTGNPDGTFAPAKTVNRAEFLTMLYRAKGVTPTATAVCMRDVIAGSWYLAVVCDAVGRGYVGGYSDGTFRAANPVNRVEAVKMLLAVLEFPIGDYTEADRAAISFPDVSLSAWYTKFLAAAFREGVLPVEGQSADAFGPEQPLSRAEAAAYIASALQAEPPVAAASSSVSSSSAAEQQESSVMTRSSRSASSASSLSVKEMPFPMTDQGMWPEKAPVLYRFSLSQKTVGEFAVALPGQGRTGLCTLFKLDAEGLPSEYYPGSVDEDRCFLRVAMPAGDYQLEMRGPKSSSYSLVARTVKGDGNDGFTEAKLLKRQSTRVSMLEVDDHADYFTFSVAAPGGEKLLVETSNTANLRCMVVPLADVDLFGFAMPACNETFAYPAGTYIVIIDRKPDNAWGKVDFGVVLKPSLN